ILSSILPPTLRAMSPDRSTSSMEACQSTEKARETRRLALLGRRRPGWASTTSLVRHPRPLSPMRHEGTAFWSTQPTLAGRRLLAIAKDDGFFPLDHQGLRFSSESVR